MKNKKNKILVVGINGSPRKNGYTVKLLKEILAEAKNKKAETLLLHLIDKNIKPCLGCYSISPNNCKYPCKQKDDMQEIYKILIKADGIVLGSPAYWFSVSGLMKNFLDRLLSLENSDELKNTYFLRGKIGGCVAIAEETGGDEVSNYMTSLMNEMGLTIPSYSTAFFNRKHKGTWKLKHLRAMGENIVNLCKALRKKKLQL